MTTSELPRYPNVKIGLTASPEVLERLNPSFSHHTEFSSVACPDRRLLDHTSEIVSSLSTIVLGVSLNEK
jgi:hypothetical protein